MLGKLLKLNRPQNAVVQTEYVLVHLSPTFPGRLLQEQEVFLVVLFWASSLGTQSKASQLSIKCGQSHSCGLGTRREKVEKKVSV